MSVQFPSVTDLVILGLSIPIPPHAFVILLNSFVVRGAGAAKHVDSTQARSSRLARRPRSGFTDVRSGYTLFIGNITPE